jgi:GAF domain-containing protein
MANRATSMLWQRIRLAAWAAETVVGQFGGDLAVATRQAIITPDVTEEPRWKEWVWLANQFDYRACWSFPVATSSGRVLGSFAMYYPEPHEATPGDVNVATVLTRAAAAIIVQYESRKERAASAIL